MFSSFAFAYEISKSVKNAQPFPQMPYRNPAHGHAFAKPPDGSRKQPFPIRRAKQALPCGRDFSASAEGAPPSDKFPFSDTDQVSESGESSTAEDMAQINCRFFLPRALTGCRFPLTVTISGQRAQRPDAPLGSPFWISSFLPLFCTPASV